MRAAAVAARDERRTGRRDGLERGDGILSAPDPGRVGIGSDKDEIVPRDLTPVDAVTLVDEFLLGLGVVDENEIRVAAPRRVERLTRALRQHMHRRSRSPW